MHHQGTRSRTHRGFFGGRRRSLLQIAAAGVVGAIIASMSVLPAQAATGDVSEGEGVLLSGSGLVNVNNVAQLKGAYSSSTSTSSLGAVSNPLDVTALNAVNVDLSNGVHLLGQNGLLTLGVNGQYANTSTTGASASSGLVSSDGSIGVGPGTPGGTTTLNLAPLFSRVGANAQLATTAQLNIGALASRIQATRGATAAAPTTSYGIAGANLQVVSPAIAGLNTSLQSTVNSTSSTLNNLVSSQGFVDSLTSNVTGTLNTAVQTLIPGATLGTPTVSVALNGLNLSAVTAPVLTKTYTSGPVTINPSTGAVTVDLNTLQALNNQPANTKLLSTQALQDVVTGAIKDILVTQIPAALNTAIVGALGNATLKVTVSAAPTLKIGLVQLNVASVNVSSTIPLSNLIVGGTTTPATTTATVSVVNNLITIDANAVAPALAPVLSGITSTVGTLLSPTLNGLVPALTTTLTAANTILAPLIGIVNQVVSITVNAQDTTTGFQDSRGNDTGASSVHAIRLSVLPILGAANVDLATSTLNTTTIAPVAITAPTANQQFTVATPTATRSITVSGTGEPGAVIAVDLGSGRTGSATVGADGTWTTSVAGVGTGTVTATATQTFGGVAGTPVSQTFSVVAQQPLAITAPTASQQFLVVSPTATRPITVSGTATAGATVALDLGSGLTATTTADSSGNWTTPVAGVGVGSYTISATQTSGGVTSAPVTRPFSVASGAGLTVTAPAANTQYVVPGATSTTTVTVTGTAQAGAAVTATLGGSLTGTATAAADGSYSIPIAGVGTAGSPYTVSVTQVVGGATSAAITRPITVVAASPLVIQSPVPNGTFTVAGPLATTPVTVSGTAQAGATVKVQLAAGVTATVTADVNGAWSAPFSNVPVGDYTASVTQTVAGVESAAVTRVFHVAAASAVTITAPASGSTTTVADPTSTIPVTVTGQAQGSTPVTVSLGSGRTQTVTSSAAGSWSATFPAVPTGGYTISAFQTVGGTASTPVTSTYSIAAGSPVVVTSPVDGATVPTADASSNADVTFRGTAQPGAAVNVGLTGGITGTTTALPDGSWSIPIAGLPNAVYTVTTSETVGATTSPQLTQTLTVKPGAPVVVTTPADGSSTQVFGVLGTTTVPVSGTATPGASVAVTFGGTTKTVTADPQGSWSTSFSSVGVGTYPISVSQTINGGTSAPVLESFSVRAGGAIVIQAPALGSTFVVADSSSTRTTTVTGMGTAGASVTVTLNGTTSQVVTALPNGSWSATFPDLAVKAYAVTASQQLLPGGPSVDAVPSAFTIAAAAPVTIATPATGASATVAGPASTLPVTIAGTAQPNSAISVAVAPGSTLTTTSDAAGAWSVTTGPLGVHAGYTATVTQTVNGTTSAGVSTTFDITAGSAFTLDTPIAGSTLTVADATGTRDVVVSGHGQIGATVSVTTGSTTQTTPVAPNGTWSTTFLGLGVGDPAFTATETVGTAPFGGTSVTAPVRTIHIVAAAAPTITAPAAGSSVVVASSTATTPVTVSGTAPDATSVTVSLGGALVHTGVPVVDGTWTTTFDALPVGSYTAAVTQAVGGTVSAPVTSSFSVAAGKPVVVLQPADGSVVTVAAADSTTPITVSGTAQAGATVQVSVGDLTGSQQVDPDGTWSVTIPGVPVGVQPVAVFQTIDGTQSAPVLSTVTVLTGAPFVITTPTEGETFTVASDTSTADVTVAGTGQPGATIALHVNGGPAIPVTVRNSGSWSTTLTKTAVSADPYTITAVETVGGTSTPTLTRHFSVAGSSVSILTPIDGTTVVVPTATSTTPVVVTGTAAPGATVTATTDGGLGGTATASPLGAYSVTIADVPVGPSTISVTQTVGGTVSPVPTTVSITVAVAADLVISTPAPGTLLTVPTAAGTTSVTLTGTAQPNAPVAVSLGAGLTATTSADDAGAWTAVVASVPVGDYTASVTQTIAGTVSAAVTVKLSVTGAKPVVIAQPVDGTSFPIANAADVVTVPVSGTAQPGASVTVSLGGTSKTVTADATTGAWSTSFAGVGQGPKQVSVTEQTSAGATAPALAAFTVDVAKAAAITSPLSGQSIQVVPGASTTVPVSGTGLAGAAVSVTLDGAGTPQTATVTPAGTWDVSFDGVGVGPHTVAVTQTVNGTDQHPVSLSFSVDATITPAAPVEITSPDPGTVIADPTGSGFVDVPVSGTGEPGSTVTVTLGDGTTLQTTVDPTGHWSVLFTHVPVGVIRITVRQTTNGVTTGSDQVGVSARTIAKAAVTAPAAGTPVVVSSPTATADVPVSGTGEPGATIAVDLGSGLTGTATVKADGTWTTTIRNVPVNGYTISVVESTADVTLPAITQPLTVKAGVGVAVTSPVDGASVSVPAAGSTTSLPVTGTADPGATVTVTLDDGSTRTVNAATDGTWSVTFTGIPTGTHTIAASEQLADGPTPAVTADVTVKLAATAVITTPRAGQVVQIPASSTANVVVSGTGEPGATMGVSLDGADGRLTTVAADGSWTTTFTQVAPGAHKASATQTVLGVKQDPASVSFTVKAAATPVTTPVIESPSTGQIIRDTDGDGAFDVPVSGVGQPGSTITVDLGQGISRTTTVGTDGTWAVTVTSVPDGARTVVVTQTTGGTVTGSASVQVTGAAIAPIVVASPTAGQSVPATAVGPTSVPVSGTAEPGAVVSVRLDNGTAVTTTADGTGAWSVSLPNVSTGDHTAAVSETLGTATSAPVTVPFTVTPAPAVGSITVTSPADGALLVDADKDGHHPVTITGTAVANAPVSVRLEDGTTLATTAGSDGSWSVTFPAIVDGVHTFVATQTVMGTETSAPQQTFTLQLIDPLTVSHPVPGSSVAAGVNGKANVPVMGTAEPGATVTITLDGGTPVTVTAAADGTWSYTFTGVAPGLHTYVATQSMGAFTSAPVATTFRVVRLAINFGGGSGGGGGTGGGGTVGGGTGGTGSGNGVGVNGGTGGTSSPAGTGGDPTSVIGQALAYTGSTVFPWAVVGAGLLALGLGMLGASRGLSRIRARKR